jgi:hypothetical protein
MQAIWSGVLRVEKSCIGINANFFGLGGDLLSALRVASKAQAAGISALTSDVFRNLVLKHLCEVISSKSGDKVVAPRAVDTHTVRLSTDADSAAISHLLSIEKGDIEDVYDATSYQAIATVTTLLNTRGNTNYYLFSFYGHLDCTRLRAACLKVFQHHELLHTVFTTLHRRALQVVLKSPEFRYQEIPSPLRRT